MGRATRVQDNWRSVKTADFFLPFWRNKWPSREDRRLISGTLVSSDFRFDIDGVHRNAELSREERRLEPKGTNISIYFGRIKSDLKRRRFYTR